MANAATVKLSNPQIPLPAAADPATSVPTLAFAMLSHRGRVRQANQDACAALLEHGAFVVCDGMGGAAGGEIASHLATEAFLDSLRHTQPNPEIDKRPNPQTRLSHAVAAANMAVFQRALKFPSLHGMGTTLVALLWHGAAANRELWSVHVGDSRCYVFRRGVLYQLTRDHSLVEEQISAGLLNRAQAAHSPVRNIITRAIGSQPSVEPEIASHAPESGDLYLLTSDGLTRELDDTQIAHILADATGTSALEPVCRALVDAANKKGGRDNITVLLVACP